MATVEQHTGRFTDQVNWLGLSRQPHGTVLNLSDEPDELCNDFCHGEEEECALGPGPLRGSSSPFIGL